MASEASSVAGGNKSPRKSIIGFFSPTGADDNGCDSSWAILASSSPDESVAPSLADVFRNGWPPSIRGRKTFRLSGRETSLPIPPSFRLKISDLYRETGDGWASGATLTDLLADMKHEFNAASAIMDEVGELIQSLQNGTESVAEILLQEMAAVVYGPNTKARRGLGLRAA
ncbi:hypothetical protein B0H67DRAFT_686411 [Lasiosphaeris hirsuta]|uniref:Uncharacterized protein n=1 Tax=Lasiosphaeris hirsuta TaxID=260670 RepID=A0AA40A2Z7_9PEZI|nr:hypothetical protein B0H67DRAFT_686411 [Lasiosphaeris hirsuta]